ncbi:hypothetical protein C0Q70_11556 [Pomacea canaliculata]|uniref:PLAT domain-containing protein n=1 Tax=Pomacea canaliculata TaxID=400727 RepID=A0A2T7P6B1_POMCA|nr:hypothetical protein C0Q70_11556 [Pomacea canaliculata]
MSSASTATETVCTCDNPPGVAFASAFMVPPNTIDFKLVFSKFDPNNASVYGTLIGLLLVWVLGVVWARRQDKKTRKRIVSGTSRLLRIWHDNSGGYQASWFLSRLDVEDLQIGQRYLFICERWLAVDKDNGVVDRFVPLAQQDEIMSFDRLFSEYTKIGITDTHLWLSCFMRPEPSTFTRVQRVSCCLVLLLLTMITSAMFYKAEDSETGDSSSEYLYLVIHKKLCNVCT